MILAFPIKALDRLWQINLATQLVDRGIIPMVGLALIFAGSWIDSAAGDSSSRPSWLDLRFWGLLFSSLLGLLFLLIFPLHLNNVRQASTQTIEQIDQQASQAEAQLQNQLGSEQAQVQLERQQSQFRSQISNLLQNEQQFNQALQNNQLPENQKKLLQQFKSDPKALDQFLQSQFSTEALRTRALGQIRGREQQVKQQAKQDAWKSGLRIGISSLLLSIGYIAIGWTGLKSIGAFQSSRRKSAR